jgi:diadenosine tetraphosphate (Ap4A) HIT family hydrolase
MNLTSCSNCLHPNEITGLLSAGLIQNLPELVPSVVFETDKAIAIAHPFPQAKFHFVIFPKRDIKNLGDIGEEERKYIDEIVLTAAKLVQERHLLNYRLWSNGPRTQAVAYLHFHLAGTD